MLRVYGIRGNPAPDPLPSGERYGSEQSGGTVFGDVNGDGFDDLIAGSVPHNFDLDNPAATPAGPV